MKKKIHSESEMVKAVQQLESGVDAETIGREHGISRATLYNWKSKYSGMEVSQVRRLKELEEENRKLKQMYADLALDNRILKEVIEKTLEPEIKKDLANGIVEEYGVSISRACKMMDIHRLTSTTSRSRMTVPWRRPHAKHPNMVTASGRSLR